MRESKSFEDALKRVLVPEKKVQKPLPKPKKKKRSSYVSEAIHGGNTASPTAVSVQGARAGGSSGMPPFSRYDDGKGAGSVDMRDIGSEEDRKAKSNGRMPYPLETVLDFIVNSGENLRNAESMIEMAIKKNGVSINDSQKQSLKDILQIVKSSLGNIGKAAKSISSINL